jgi:hypothetical protein
VNYTNSIFECDRSFVIAKSGRDVPAERLYVVGSMKNLSHSFFKLVLEPENLEGVLKVVVHCIHPPLDWKSGLIGRSPLKGLKASHR